MSDKLNRYIKRLFTYKSKYGSIYQVYINKTSYHDGNTCLTIVDSEDGELIAVATVNLPDNPIPLDKVYIKDYSENEGILAFLQSNDIVGPTLRDQPTGFVTVQLCKVLI